MIAIPEELLEQVERGNVLLFIGERIIHDTDGQMTVDRLTSQLVARCGVADSQVPSFPEVAQVYEDEKGRHALIQFLRDQLRALGDEPQRVHHLIAGLNDCNVLITTGLTCHLERAFEAAGRPLNVVIENVDVVFEDEQKARLYKLRGSLDRPELLILTEDDHEAFFRTRAHLSLVLQGQLARKTILFIGYDLAEPLFKRLYYEVTAPLDNYARRAYAFGEAPSQTVCRWCERHGIDVIKADTTAFLEALTEQLKARARPISTLAQRSFEEPAAPLPERPYKLLDYYEARDASIFFGRAWETQKLSSLIHAHRLVLLYGASGTGKTSLLLAGVAPRLERAEPPYETVYVRALEDPASAIRRAVQRKLSEANLPTEGALVELLDAATRSLGRTLIIILDQFEEFFIRLSPQFRAAFIAELGALYDAYDVPVKVVLSLREDWLAAVNEVRQRIPEVFYVDMRLLPLTRELAQEAITGPVGRLGVSYEPALVTRLLDDLAGGEEAVVMPPQLQLVCSALYDGLQPDGRQISLVAYERLGGARGVLQQYLDDELARLGSGERALARSALEELVTSQGTKAVKTLDELALALRVDGSDLELVLEKLVRARLLRRLEHEEGGLAYELAHEYLIREIGLGTEAQKRKQREELIRRKIEDWQHLGWLLSAQELAWIGEVRGIPLNGKAQELLLRSALQTGQGVEYWLSRVNNPKQVMAILDESSQSEQSTMRRSAARAMGMQGGVEAVEPLLKLAVHDPDSTVRSAARRSLVGLEAYYQEATVWLQEEVKRTEGRVRQAALETLAVLPRTGLPITLRLQVLAQVLIGRTRRNAAWIVQWVLANITGGAAGWLVCKGLFGVVYVMGFGTVFGNIRASENGVLLGAIFGFLSGVILGLVQWIALPRKVGKSGWWVLATTVGWAAGGAVGGVVGWIMSAFLGWAISETAFWAVFGAVGGLTVGTAQYLVLRRQRARSGWWLLSNVVGWTLGWVMVSILLNPISEAVIDLILAMAWGSDETVYNVFSDIVRWFVGGAVLGIAGGVITGISLVGLLDKSIDNEVANGVFG